MPLRFWLLLKVEYFWRVWTPNSYWSDLILAICQRINLKKFCCKILVEARDENRSIQSGDVPKQNNKKQKTNHLNEYWIFKKLIIVRIFDYWTLIKTFLRSMAPWKIQISRLCHVDEYSQNSCVKTFKSLYFACWGKISIKSQNSIGFYRDELDIV